MKKLFSFLLVAIAFQQTVAQSKCDDWNWPEDKKTVEEKLAVYTDAKKAGDFRTAANNLRWLLINTPDLHNSIYINGAQIYESLADDEKDPAKKRVFQDSSLLMYDMRIQYCDNEASVINRKAFAAYQFFKDDKSRMQELYELFKRAFQMNPDEIWENNLVAYMDVVRRLKLAGGKVTDDEVLNIYDQINNIIEDNIEKGISVPKNEKYQETLFQILKLIIPMDCDFIKNSLVPKSKENPDDLDLAKKIVGLSLTAKCTDTDFFIDAAKKVFEAEPTYGLAWTIGSKCLAADDYNCADFYLNKAISLTSDNDKKSDIYYKLATLAYHKDDFPKSREMALKSVSLDPSRKEAYSLVGKLYMSSYNQCKGDVDKVKDRLVFIAAYEMFKKAGDEEGMKSAHEQFPSIEEMFERNYQKGQALTIGCWIGETVVLQTRD